MSLGGAEGGVVDAAAGAALVQSHENMPVALKAKRLQASSLDPSSDCRCTHPEAPRCFLNREQNPVILGSLALEIDIAGLGPTLDAEASQHPVVEQLPYPFTADAQPPCSFGRGDEHDDRTRHDEKYDEGLRGRCKWQRAAALLPFG